MRVLLIGLVAFAAIAQQAPPARDTPAMQVKGTAIVSGTVFVGAEGSKPSRQTRVTLNAGERAIPGMTATTDDDGRFVFENVPAGRFTLQAIRPGYLTASYGAARPGRTGTAIPVPNGGKVSGLTLRILKGGVVTGNVRDANGRPLSGVTVDVLRYQYSELNGELELANVGGASRTRTDDRGVYRVWGLLPGNYAVRASPQMGSARSGTGPSDFQPIGANDVARAIAAGRARGAGGPAPALPAPRMNYAPVFFPATPDVSQAVTITLKQAEERDNVDVTVRLFPTSRISGSVRMFDGSPLPAPISAWLTAAGPQGDLLGARGPFPRKTTTIAADGRMLLTDVAPGRYFIQASTVGLPGGRSRSDPGPAPPALYALADVSVQGTDVSVDLTLQPAMTATGRFAFDGNSDKPADLSALQIFLVPPGAGGNLSAGAAGRPSADGLFTITNVIPGAYRVLVLGAAGGPGSKWVLQSVTGNGRDAWDSWLQVAPGENIDLVITYSDHPTEIAGTLRDENGQPLAEHSIIIFPADRSKWIPGTKRIRTARPGIDGQFSVFGLPAGDYLLVAVTDVGAGEWNDPAFLDALAQAGPVKFSLTDGEKKRQDLQIKK